MKCKWPLNHISISSTGVYRPCCAWLEQDDQPTVAQNSVEQYLESDFYKSLMEKMKNDQFHVGCKECMLDEKSGISGMLDTGNRKYQDKETFSIRDMEVKFGNKCNAGCVMCSAYNSSLIYTENQKHDVFKNFRKQPNYEWDTWYEDEGKFDEIVQLASKCNNVRFTGGEPTVDGLLEKFLEKLIVLNDDIKIQITTNGSSFSKKLETTIAKFREVRMNLSIDGYGKANDFIRWPIKWDKLERNVNRMQALPNTILNVEVSLQAAGVASLPDLINWCNNKNLVWNVNSVYSPAHLQPSLASEQHKERVRQLGNKKINKLLEFNSSKADADQLRNTMIAYFDALERVRGISWKDHVSI